MIRRPPRSTRTDTLFPCAPLFLSNTVQFRGATWDRRDGEGPGRVASHATVTQTADAAARARLEFRLTCLLLSGIARFDVRCCPEQPFEPRRVFGQVC